MKEPRYIITYRYKESDKSPEIIETTCFDNINELETFIYCVDGYEKGFIPKGNKISEYTVTVNREDWELEEDEDR